MPGPPAPPRPPRRVGLLAAVAAVFLLLDVVTKVIAAATLEGSEPVRVLGGAMYLQLVRNPGAAFGMGVDMTWVLAVVKILVAFAIVWFARRIRSAGWAVGLGLVLAGALGNVVDRVFRAPAPFQGHVVDFLSAFAPNGEAWPVFNVADSAVCVGAVLIVVLSLLGKDYDGTSTQDRKAAAAGTAEGDGA
nr:signal peptidase II [Amycolatopsis antarctica]